MASIEKRGDYTYRIIVSTGYDRNGKKITHKKTVTIDTSLTPKQTEKELNRIATVFEENIRKGDVIDSTITFEKFVDRWLIEHADKRLEKTTIESYKGELNTKILPAIGHLKLSELKPLHLIKFFSNLGEDGVRIDGKSGGYSTRIIKYQHSIISSILQTAVYWQVINDNVAKRVKPQKGDDIEKEENYFDEIQAKNFLEYVLESEPLIYQALAFVTMYGGLRKGEVLGLTWNDVNLSDNSVSINKSLARASTEVFIKEPKNTTSNRIVTLPSIAITLLKELKLSSTSTSVFPICYSTPTQWFQRIVRNYNKSHDDKLPTKVTFHGLRHTSATLLIAQNMDIKTISARLGHSDATTTLNIYTHAIKSRDKVASDALESILDIDRK